MARGAVKVVSINGALTVTFTAASGATPTAFSDEACTTSVSLPATVSDGANTTFYFASPGSYTLSVKTSGGIQIAGDLNSTKVVTVAAGDVGVYAYDTRLVARDASGDSGRHSPNTDLSAAYVAPRGTPSSTGPFSLPHLDVKDYGATGDGVTDDLAALNAAATAAKAASAFGVTLVISPGTYKVSTTWVIKDTTNLTIRSENATISGTDASNQVMRLDSVRGFAMYGRLSINHNVAGARVGAADGLRLLNCSDGYVTGVTVSACKSIGIRVAACKRVSVYGNIVNASLADGIGVYTDLRRSGSTGSISSASSTLTVNDATNLPLSSNDIGSIVLIPGAGAAGATLVTTITAVADSTHATIATPASTTVASKVITIGRGNDHISVFGNHVESSGDDSFSCVSYNNDTGTSWTAVNTDVVFQGNTSRQSGARGLVVAGGTRVVISGNAVDGPAGAGVAVIYDSGAASQGVTDCTVSDNVINGSGRVSTTPAINVNGTSTTFKVQGVTISDNTIRGPVSSNYIFAGGGSAGTYDVMISGNRCVGGTTSNHGIQAQNVQNVAVRGNRVTGSWLCNITMSGNTGLVRCQDNDTDASNAGASGFPGFILSDTNMIISGNRIADGSLGNGIDASSATTPTIFGNAVASGGITTPGGSKKPVTAVNAVPTLDTTATTGAAGAPPAQVVAYKVERINGTDYKVPLYNL